MPQQSSKKLFLLCQGEIARKAIHECDLSGVSIVGASAPVEWHAELSELFQLDARKIHSCDTKDLTGLLDALNSSGADALLSIQYPWIIDEDHLKVVSGHAYNLHNAALPDYRGHNALTHVILNGDSVHVTTLHKMAREVDRGYVYLERATPVAPDETAFSLYAKCMEAAKSLLQDFFTLYGQDALKVGRAVGHGGRYYSKNSVNELRRAPDGAQADYLERLARAMYFPPHEPPYLQVDGRKLYLLPQAFRN